MRVLSTDDKKHYTMLKQTHIDAIGASSRRQFAREVGERGGEEKRNSTFIT